VAALSFEVEAGALLITVVGKSLLSCVGEVEE